ncbi:MAG: bifunctional folylpolyglutamate synthase/dihydrofolate synthase, partial [Campylobacteraceae bacterium]|nr:bifunctional folylpolyglutamate synthase/dihydrofolate synthase [Campylobacteraceae bacterium]
AAARANLDEFKGKKIILIYNAYKDKDYRKILDILSPIILHVELIDMNDSERENAKEEIKNYLDFLQIKHKEFKNIDKDRDYLVFGSFLVVEAFLKRCCGK